MEGRIEDYDFELPERLIAQEPLEDRSASRLLVLNRETGALTHRTFVEVPDMLAKGDLLVVNDTRVTAKRLFGTRPSGGKCEVLLLERLSDGGAFGSTVLFRAMVKPARRLPVGGVIRVSPTLVAVVESVEPDGLRTVRLEGEDAALQAEREGYVPLPPYIHRLMRDGTRYQTVYAAHGGSAAAPTAGLHFTEEILDRLSARGVGLARVTLDVGLDTFRPITADFLQDHKIHGELCRVGPETAEQIARTRGRIVAVGTTSVRTLETFAAGPRQVRVGEARSSLFITPGYQFQVVDGMFTNFHMPRTTMLAMLAAMVGRERLLKAYQSAIDNDYRFLSFGDGMLII